MLLLYQFPISHYCEKVRWALNFKELHHRVKNLLPGLHMLKTKKLAANSSVPILTRGEEIIQGSRQIISWLDDKFPEKELTPTQPELRDKALKWEEYLDSELGVDVRRCCYDILLEYPKIVIPFFTHNGPWYGKVLIRFMYPNLKLKMRKAMDINDESVKLSRQRLGKAIDRLYHHYQDQEFLAGNQFSRADLTAASLLAPLCMPEKYGLNWPGNLPEQLLELRQEFQHKTAWVNETYRKFR